MNWKIWLFVPIAYLAFALWYFNWQGPLTEDEIEAFFATYERQQGSGLQQRERFRKFLEQDDGKEFVMLNQVQFFEGEIEHPETGKPTTGEVLIGEYFKPFALALLKRGGHPVFQARTVGDNIDSWNAEQNKSFAATAMMRYRSRRDLIELAVDPAFVDSHFYKIAAIERTISYPTQYVMNVSLQPPVTVLVILVLLVSLFQNLLFWRRDRQAP